MPQTPEQRKAKRKECNQRFLSTAEGKAKHKIAQDRWKANNRDKLKAMQRDGNLKRNYGITSKDYDNMLLEQDNKCAICGSDGNIGKGKRLHVDHNHNTGLVRGLLCTLCNTALGKFKDDISILKSAIDYLEREKKYAETV